LTAAEFFLPEGLALVRDATGLPAPLDAESPFYLLVEVGQPDDGSVTGGLLGGLVAALGELGEIGAATAADDATGMARLWRYRESQPESMARAGVPVKLDVSVPSERLAAVLDELPALVDDAARGVGCPTARVVTYGHLAEGNLHVNVLGAVDPQAADAVTDAVLRRVAAVGGSVSAEHGVGRAKVPWLSLSRTDAELAAMTAVKRALDPSGMLGPGVLLPAAPDDSTRGDE
jgi:FAD/FMN-containing dehydrogenase